MAQAIDFDPWLVAWLNARVPELGSRVAPYTAPQAGGTGGGLPHCLYVEVSMTRIQSAQGPTGLARCRVQVDVWSPDKGEAKAIADKIAGVRDDAGLDGFRGEITRAGVGRLKVQRVQMLDGFTDQDDPEHGTAAGEFRVSRDYEIWFEEYVRPIV